MGIDKEIDVILKYYEEHMPKVAILKKNNERYDEAKQAIKEIADFVWETDENADIQIMPDELTGTSALMTITTSLVVIDMIDKFCNALSKANNFEICAKKNGMISMGIVFEGVCEAVKPIVK